MDNPGDFVLQFGKKYKDMKLDDIAETDEGLEYLDWLMGQDFVWDDTRDAIGAYLAIPGIADELRKIVGT